MVGRLVVVGETSKSVRESGVMLQEWHPGFEKETIKKLQQEFQDVLSLEPWNYDTATITIDTGNAKPIHQHLHRLPERLRESVHKEIELMLKAKMIAPSTSPWASPIVPILKGDGTAQVCVDYQQVNMLTVPDNTYMSSLGTWRREGGVWREPEQQCGSGT